MKALAICNKGFETESSQEIIEIISAKIISKENGIIIFETEEKELCKLTYFAQTLHKTFILLSESSTITELAKQINCKEYEKFLKEPIKAFAKVENNNKEIILEFMTEFENQLKNNSIELQVSMSKYKTPIYIIQDKDKYFCGIDFSGKDLSKRDYRIFCHKNALNATVATALLYTADFRKLKNSEKTIILDPFCGSGTVPIETIIKLKGISPQKFEEDQLAYIAFFQDKFETKPKENKVQIIGYDHMLPSIKSAQKNSKIANINKEISLSKVAVDWLETKFDEKSVDLIITNPPVMSHNHPDKNVDKSLKEFFYQAEFIMKKSGKIIIINPNTDYEEFIDNTKFDIIEKRSIMQGLQELQIVVLQKK